jgi:DNA polymerase-3 subunit delta'
MLRTPQIWPRDGVKEFPPDAALLRDLHFGPAQGRVRVFIIEHAETMNEDTANSVLKVLEEPPTYAQFILTAPEPYALLPTIASRCHAVPFHLVPAIAIEQHLMAQYGIQDHMARFLATYVQGKIGLAIDLTKEEGLMDARKALLDLADRISAPNPPVYCLGLAEELRQLSSALLPSRKSEHGAETGQRSAIASGLDIVSTWYGDLLSLCVRPDKAEIVNTDRLKELRVRAGDYTANTLVQCIAIIQAIKVTCERNANAQIATEMLMAELVARNVKASAT